MSAEGKPAVVFRQGSDGLAHACAPGFATAFCGHQCKLEVKRGTPCPRCMKVATDRAAATPT